MYGTYSGTLYTSSLTAVGGVFCYPPLSTPAPLITSLPGLAKPLDAMRRALSPGRARASGRSVMISNSNGGNGNVWTYLLLLRVPPHRSVRPDEHRMRRAGCTTRTVCGDAGVGSIPWNFVTCQVGRFAAGDRRGATRRRHDGVRVEDKAKSSAGGGMRAIVDRIWNREMW